MPYVNIFKAGRGLCGLAKAIILVTLKGVKGQCRITGQKFIQVMCWK